MKIIDNKFFHKIINKWRLIFFDLKKSDKERGVTLMELLIVISIIGLISSVTVAGWSTIKAKSRDARRVADIKTLRTALDAYYIDKKQYPQSMAVCPGAAPATAYLLQNKTDLINSALIADGVIMAPIRDPINGISDGVTYGFFYNSCGVQADKTPDPDASSATVKNNEYYALTFVLETDNFVAQGYKIGNNCVGPRVGELNKSLDSSFNGSILCNPAP